MDLGPSWVFVLERLGGASTRTGGKDCARGLSHSAAARLAQPSARSARLSAQQAWRSLSFWRSRPLPPMRGVCWAGAQRRVPFATTTKQDGTVLCCGNDHRVSSECCAHCAPIYCNTMTRARNQAEPKLTIGTLQTLSDPSSAVLASR